MESSSFTPNYVIAGNYTAGTMPPVATNKGMFAWDTNFACYMQSDGTTWKPTCAGVSTYTGNTNASGDYTVVFAIEKSGIPNVQPSLQPPNNAAMVCRLTAASTTGFTVKVEQRTSITVLAVDLLSFAVTNVNNQALKVLVID
jgi:hypothetical protein